MTTYDDLWHFMSKEQRNGNCHKMSLIVVKCRKLSWHLSQIVVTFFFPGPLPPSHFGFRRIQLCSGAALVVEFRRSRLNCERAIDRERKMRTNFFAQTFWTAPGVRDIPAKFPGHPRFLFWSPRKTNFRGRARTFRPPPLPWGKTPIPTRRSPDEIS